MYVKVTTQREGVCLTLQLHWQSQVNGSLLLGNVLDEINVRN